MNKSIDLYLWPMLLFHRTLDRKPINHKMDNTKYLYKISFYLLFFGIRFLFSDSKTIAQERSIAICMKDTVLVGGLSNLMLPMTDLDSSYSGFPDNISHVKISKYPFQRDQFIYQEYKQGFYTNKTFSHYYKQAKPDTSMLSKKPLRNYVSVLTAVDISNKRKIMILDLNSDRNFSNDPLIYLHSGVTDYPFYQFDGIQFIYSGKIIEKKAWIRPGRIVTVTEKKNGQIVNNELITINVKGNNRYGRKKIGGSLYGFTVYKPFTDLVYNKGNSILTSQVEVQNFSPDTPKSDPIEYKRGDTLLIGHYSLLFSSISENGDTLYLQVLSRADKGYQTGYTAFDVVGKDVLTGRIIHTSKMKGCYILLDFWGTWCGPCKETIPDLKSLNKLYSNRLKIIGIAYDKSVKEVLSYVKAEKVNWINIFDPKDTQGICSKFKIQTFPTFVLLDPQGKIVLRGSGKDYLPAVSAYLRLKF